MITQEMKAQLYSAILANIVPTDPVVQTALDNAMADSQTDRVLKIDKASDRTQERWDLYEEKVLAKYSKLQGDALETALQNDVIYQLRLSAFKDSMARYKTLKG